MYRRCFEWLLLVVLPLTVLGAAPPAKGRGTELSFSPVSLAEVSSLQVLIFNLEVRPGRPEYPPSPCDVTLTLNDNQGKLLKGPIPHTFEQTGNGSMLTSWQARVLASTGASAVVPAIQMRGANGRSCSGIVASVQVNKTTEKGPTVDVMVPTGVYGKKLGPPTINTTPLNAYVLAPVAPENGEELGIHIANLTDVAGHHFPPSPCLPAVQFHLANGDTVGGEQIGSDASYDVFSFPDDLPDESATAVVLLSGQGCHGLSVTGELLNNDGMKITALPAVQDPRGY
jgi:hypothetical protein